MFQTVKHFQNKPGGKPGKSALSSKTFRDTFKLEAAIVGGMSSTVNSNNDAEQLSCWATTKEHVKRELWSFVGLLGVLCLYFGVLVCVYALKGIFTPPGLMTLCGVLLTTLGGVSLLISWMIYRFQRRKRRFSCFCEDEDGGHAPTPKRQREKTRPRGHSLAGFLTPEFAKYAEFSARDRRYDSKRHNFFRAYDPTQISITFAHKYWLEQQKPLLQTAIGNPSFFPSSVHTSPRKNRTPNSTEPKRKLLEKVNARNRRQLST